MSNKPPKHIIDKVNDSRFYFRVFLIIALVAAIPLVKISHQQTIKNILYLNFIPGEKTTGTVIKSQRNKAADYTGTRSNNYQHKPAYDVTVEFTDKKGAIHTASATLLKNIDKGAKITVTYAPDNPSIIDYPKFRSAYITEWLCALIVVLIFAPLAIFNGISYFSKKRALTSKSIITTATLASSQTAEENDKKIIEQKWDYIIDGKKHTLNISYSIQKLDPKSGGELFLHSVNITGEDPAIGTILDQPRWHKSTPNSGNTQYLFTFIDKGDSFFENKNELSVIYFPNKPELTTINDPEFLKFFESKKK